MIPTQCPTPSPRRPTSAARASQTYVFRPSCAARCAATSRFCSLITLSWCCDVGAVSWMVGVDEVETAGPACWGRERRGGRVSWHSTPKDYYSTLHKVLYSTYVVHGITLRYAPSNEQHGYIALFHIAYGYVSIPLGFSSCAGRGCWS